MSRLERGQSWNESENEAARKRLDDAYRRGFEASKAEAAKLVSIERHIAAETGDPCDLSHLEDLIKALKPEDVT